MGGEDGPIIVPATSANLGCGFDCAALALSLYMKVRGRLGPEPGFRCRYRGPHSERIPSDDSNLVARAARLASERAGADVRGGEIEIENEISVAAGLGASGAAIVFGILPAARHPVRFAGSETVAELADRLARQPDNAAAARAYRNLGFTRWDTDVSYVR